MPVEELMRRALRSLYLLCSAFALCAGAGTRTAVTGPRQSCGMLIVAPARFLPALQPFIRFKRRRLLTRVVSLEESLLRSGGVDDPERLKRYLFNAWRRDGIRYVLLVGDADVLPVRYMVLDRVTPAAFDYAFYPSDLYYADLAKQDGRFEDWNARKDGFHAGYFGEVRGEKNKQDPINYDDVDYRPDVAVGRWPVSTPEEVRVVADKTMRYEEGLERGDRPGAGRAALFAVGGWVDARGNMYRMAADLVPGWAVEKRYYSGDGRDDHTGPPNEAELDKVLNEGVELVCHAGHGSDDTWWHCFDRAHLDRLHNADRLPVMISAGCSTARFATLPPYEPYVDVEGKEHRGTEAGEVFHAPPPPPAPYQRGKYNMTGLGEQLLKRGPDGAVAYIGCNTGSQPCALTLEAGFVHAIGRSAQPRLGNCWAEAVSYYYDEEHLATLKPNDDWYPPSIFFQGMKYMLFGDPSIPLLPARR